MFTERKTPQTTPSSLHIPPPQAHHASTSPSNQSSASGKQQRRSGGIAPPRRVYCFSPRLSSQTVGSPPAPQRHDATRLASMGTAFDMSERMAHIHMLDLDYQKALHQADNISRDEEARRLKLRSLSLRDENAALKDKLLRGEAQIGSAARQGDQVRAELDDAKATVRSQDARLKKQAMEINNLKVEVEAHSNTMQDSGKVLQEKFALSRELSRLRPEMEHLQSQLTNHQAVVAEKHDLRRQLDSLEVELDNERRSRQRTRNKEDNEAVDDLRSRLDAAEKRLSTEKREREKARKEHEKEMAEGNGRCERLEERVSALKAKLKGVQTEAKEAQVELEKCRAELEAAGASSRGANQRPKKTVTVQAEPTRKRRAEEMSLEEVTIETPGNDNARDRRPNKKRGTDHAAPGEKSAFSITPFLNRSKKTSGEATEAPSPEAPATRAAPEATEEDYSAEPIPEPESEQENAVQAADEPQDEPPAAEDQAEAAPGAVEPPKKQKPRGRPPKAKALAEASASKANASAAPAEKAASRKPRSKPNKEEPADEASPQDQEQDQENAPAPGPRKRQEPPAKAAEPRTSVAKTGPADGEVRKRKRKLLGGGNQTLMGDEDDDDGESVVSKPAKAAPGQTRRVKASLGGGVTNAFAGGSSFSPLKRDRRGVHASFLA